MDFASRLMRFIARRSRPERGSVLILASVVTVASLGASAFAVDFGRGVAFKRELQAEADIAAMDAARALGNRFGEDAADLAEEALVRNGFPVGAVGTNWAVRLGRVDPETRAFTASAGEVATAVEVKLSAPLDWVFQPGGRTYTAEGVAEGGSRNNVCDGDCDGGDPGDPPGGGTGDNNVPVAVDDLAHMWEGDPPITVSVLNNDSGLEDVPVSVTLGVLSPAGSGSVSLSGNDAVFAPSAGFTGDASVPYTVTDANNDAATATLTITVYPSNPSPFAAPDREVLCPSSPPVTINVLANDSGLNDTPVVVTLGTLSPAAAGALSLSGNNAVFTPDSNFRDDATFPYTVSDADGDADTATVTVTGLNSCGGDDTPAPVADPAQMCQGSPPITIRVLANDSGLRDTPVVVTLGAVSPAGAGSASLSGNDVVFAAGAGFTGDASVPYTVTDADGDSGAATLTVTVDPPCDPPDHTPLAQDDVDRLCRGDAPVAIRVLANDSGLNDAPISLTLGALSPAGAGSLSLSGSDVVFTPAAGFIGNATFPYTLTDADGDSDPATVTITVDPCNPQAVPDDVILCEEPAFTIDVLANDSGLNSPPITLTLGAVAPAAAGSVGISGTNVLFTRTSGFTGNATFPYTITDAEGDSDTATVTVTVRNSADCTPPSQYQTLGGIALGSFLARVDTSGGLLKDVFGRFLNGNVTLVGYTGIAAGSVRLGQLRAALNFGTVDELLTTQVTARNLLLAMVTVLQNKGDAASVQAASDLMNLALAANSSLNVTLGNVVQVAQGAEGSAATAELNALQLAMMVAQVANGQNAVDITLTTQSMGSGLSGLLSPLGGNTLRLKVIEPMQIKIGPPGKYANGQWKTVVKTAQVRAQIHLRPLSTISGGLLDVPIYLEAASATAALRSITCREPFNDSTAVVRANSQAVRADVGVVADINASASVTVNNGTILDLLLTDVTGRAQVNLASSGGDLSFNGPFNWSNTQTIGSTTLDLGDLLRARPVTLTLLGLNVGGLLSSVAGIINPILTAADEGLIDFLLSSLGVSLGGGDVTVWGIDCANPTLVR